MRAEAAAAALCTHALCTHALMPRPSSLPHANHTGAEMGQGLSTKAAQAAAHALGELLPPSQRAGLFELVSAAPPDTRILVHSGGAVASTTSEGACFAIRVRGCCGWEVGVAGGGVCGVRGGAAIAA